MTGWGYLGPEGTFSEIALLALLAQEPVHDLLVREEHADEPELRAYPSVVAAIAGVRAGEVLGAVVPLENSVEGAVAQTLDELATGEPVAIIGETELPVTFALLARPGTALEDVRTIGTHPHAEAQTRRWVAEHVPTRGRRADRLDVVRRRRPRRRDRVVGRRAVVGSRR